MNPTRSTGVRAPVVRSMTGFHELGFHELGFHELEGGHVES
jgi:hypothetical protein